MKLTFLKKIWSKIKKVKINDLLQILLVATVVLIVVTIITPQLTNPQWGSGGPPIKAYFDIFIRYGIFIFIYFTLIPILVLWLVKKVFKKRWGFKIGLFFLVPTLFVLTAIYFVIPGPIYGNPFNVSWLEHLTDLSLGKTVEVVETEHEFCGQRLDFFYNPGCKTSKLPPELETIKNQLEFQGSSIEFNVWCLSGGKCSIKSGASCEEYEEGKYTFKDVKYLVQEYNVDSLPALVIGCKYQVFGKYEVKELICEKLGECDL